MVKVINTDLLAKCSYNTSELCNVVSVWQKLMVDTNKVGKPNSNSSDCLRPAHNCQPIVDFFIRKQFLS